MSLIINSNFAATLAANNLAASGRLLRNSLNRLSSGSKIVNPADDAGGLAVSMQLSATAKRQAATSKNVANAVSFLQTQDGTLKVAGKVLERLGELKTLSIDPTKSSSDRANYQTEFAQLQDELNAVDNETFNGKDLFGFRELDVNVTADGGSSLDIGSTSLAGTLAPEFADFDDNFADLSNWTNISFAGGTISASNNELHLDSGLTGFGTARSTGWYEGAFQITLDVKQDPPGGVFTVRIGNDVVAWYAAADSAYHEMRIEYDGFGEAKAYLDAASNPFDTRSFAPPPGGNIAMEQFQVTTTSVKNYHISSTAVDPSAFRNIQQAGNLESVDLSTISNAIEEIAGHRAKNGARQARLGFADELLNVNRTNLEQANSRITDVDVAQETTQMARFNILMQAGTAMLAQANQTPQLALRLLT